MILDLSGQLLWGVGRQALTAGAITYDSVHGHLYFIEGNCDFADGEAAYQRRSSIHVWQVKAATP